MKADEVDLLREVDVGCTVWHRLPLDPNFVDRRGGLVAAIDTHVDAETGEVSRLFRVISRWHGRLRFDQLRADEINPEVLELPNPRLVANTSRMVAGEYAATKGQLTEGHLRLIETAYNLAKGIA